jgi:hypothetical protein
MSYYPDILKYIVAKKESVPGVPETLSSSDFDISVNVHSIDYIPNVGFDNNSNEKEGHEGEYGSLAGSRRGILNFSINWYPNSDYAGAPSINKLLNACGLKDTSLGGISNWSSSPVWENYQNSLTFEFVRSALGAPTKKMITKLSGCMGNFRIRGSIGSTIIIEFSFQGVIWSETEVTQSNYDLTYETENALTYKNTPFLIDDTDVCVSDFELDSGNVISVLPDQGAASKLSRAYIKKRTPRLNLNPIMVDKSVYDFYNTAINNTPQKVEILIPGLNIIIPRAKFLNPTETSRENRRSYDINMELLRSNGDYFGIAEEAQYALLQQ